SVTLRLHARAGDRQDLPRDAMLFHHLQTLLAEIGQSCIKLRRLGRRDIDHGRPPIGLGCRIQEMLLERDLFDHAVLPQGRRPLIFSLWAVSDFGLTCPTMQGGIKTAGTLWVAS